MKKPAQMTFDYRELEPEDRASKEREERIRDTAKLTAQGIVKIGQWLTEAKARPKHGKWLPWLKASFGWSQPTTFNFMQVYERFKLSTFDNLRIDVSALYLIAAKATPEPVVQEVIKRAKAGEPMTRAKAKKVLEDYKKRVEAPTPAVARQIAIATGKPTAASNNTFVLPMSAQAERELIDEQGVVCDLYPPPPPSPTHGIGDEERVIHERLTGGCAEQADDVLKECFYPAEHAKILGVWLRLS
jgi:Protein of unknown function (DUF3102)